MKFKVDIFQLPSGLFAISIPWEAMRCADMKCTDHSLHCHAIQVFHDTLMESCISACEANIPYTFTFIYYHLYTCH